jgi:DNA polymerase-3 subunit epsilon
MVASAVGLVSSGDLLTILHRIMREIVFDTETTGLDPKSGDRIVEIGGIELFNHIPTGRSFHRYLNPERTVPVEASRVHGLDDAFLKDKPLFAAVVDEMLEFFGDAQLIAHNAMFDLGFLNAELSRLSRQPIAAERIVDTLVLARRKHPGSPASLDALMTRYQIDSSRRTMHGALLDAELLSEVYIELIGGRQTSLGLGVEAESAAHAAAGNGPVVVGERVVPRAFQISAEDVVAHQAAVAALGDKALWRKYLPAVAA